MIVRACIAGLAFLAMAGAAQARTFAPGWYVVEDDPHGKFVKAGPFADEAACKRARPRDHDEDGEIRCLNLAARPAWWR